MRPGREIDTRIAKEVFGYNVWAQNKVLFESAPKGDRPLRSYSKDMQWAQDIIMAMHMTLIPIEGGQWFVFVGPEHQEGWQSPQAVLELLTKGPFNTCGAASGTDLPALICEAALKAVEKRAALKGAPTITAQNPLQEDPASLTTH